MQSRVALSLWAWGGLLAFFIGGALLAVFDAPYGKLLFPAWGLIVLLCVWLQAKRLKAIDEAIPAINDLDVDQLIAFEQFNAAWKTRRRQMFIVVIPPVALALLGTIIAFIVGRQMRTAFTAWFGETVGDTSSVLLILPALPVAAIMAWWYGRNYKRLSCPHCHSDLLNLMPRRIARTRKCTRCERRVLKEPAAIGQTY